MLSRTGELLSSSIDYRETLQRVAQLAIPELADSCAVYVPHEGSLELVSIAHRDPAKLKLSRTLYESYPPTMSDPRGVAQVLRSGEPEMAQIGPEALEAMARDERHLALLRELGPGSLMMLPMKASDSVVGALIYINETDRRPLLAACHTQRELRDEVRLTVLHEIGHYFGIEDAELPF